MTKQLQAILAAVLVMSTVVDAGADELHHDSKDNQEDTVAKKAPVESADRAADSRAA